jgi:hypothetical protein
LGTDTITKSGAEAQLASDGYRERRKLTDRKRGRTSRNGNDDASLHGSTRAPVSLTHPHLHAGPANRRPHTAAGSHGQSRAAPGQSREPIRDRKRKKAAGAAAPPLPLTRTARASPTKSTCMQATPVDERIRRFACSRQEASTKVPSPSHKGNHGTCKRLTHSRTHARAASSLCLRRSAHFIHTTSLDWKSDPTTSIAEAPLSPSYFTFSLFYFYLFANFSHTKNILAFKLVFS